MLRVQEASCSTSAAFHTQPLVRCPPAGGTGSPHGFCSQQAHGGHKRAMTVAFHSVAARTGEAIRREHLFALDAATPNCCQERQMHLHSELLCGCVFSDLRRLTFYLSGRPQTAKPAVSCPLDGRVGRHVRGVLPLALDMTKARLCNLQNEGIVVSSFVHDAQVLLRHALQKLFESCGIRPIHLPVEV